jgi:lipoate-protein ligase A
METPPETTDFMRTLAVRLAEYAGEQDEPRAFSDAERERIQAIRDLTYTTWEWNFGRTPRYELDRPMLNGGGERVADIRMTVENGYISSISFGRNGSMRPLEQTLLGTAHNHASIRAALALHSDILDARRMSLGEATAALF